MRICCNLKHDTLRILCVASVVAHLLFNFTQAAHAAEFPGLEKLQAQGANTSALVINLSSGQTLSQWNSSQRLSPASVTKLVLGAKALETWGPGKTFNSPLYVRGNVNAGVLNGDLIFYGAGDSSLTNEKLWFLTSDVARVGITKITGKIIVNNSLFGNIDPDENRLHGLHTSHNAYDAPLSSAAVNFSVLALIVSPGDTVGKMATINIEPYRLSSIKIVNKVLTTSSTNSKIMVERTTSLGQDTYIISGKIAKGSPLVRVYRSISDANVYAAQVLDAFLNHSGVTTSGQIAVESVPLRTTDKFLLQVEGYPLEWQLKGLFKVSNNFIADMLTLNLRAAELHTASNQRITLTQSSLLLQNYMCEVIRPGCDTKTASPLVLHSGSGLTPENRLSAKDLVALLSRMYFKEYLFPEFLSALAEPGNTGSLKERFARMDEPHSKIMLRAKTGTLTEPFDVVTLAGYARIKNGDWIAFAFLVNGTKQKPTFGIDTIRQTIDADLTRILLAPH